VHQERSQETSLSLLRSWPNSPASVRSTKEAELRACGGLFLNRVGYFLYYKAEAGELKVLAFWHSSRERQPFV
jgi:hypothetical protein